MQDDVDVQKKVVSEFRNWGYRLWYSQRLNIKFLYQACLCEMLLQDDEGTWGKFHLQYCRFQVDVKKCDPGRWNTRKLIFTSAIWPPTWTPPDHCFMHEKRQSVQCTTSSLNCSSYLEWHDSFQRPPHTTNLILNGGCLAFSIGYFIYTSCLSFHWSYYSRRDIPVFLILQLGEKQLLSI